MTMKNKKRSLPLLSALIISVSILTSCAAPNAGNTGSNSGTTGSSNSAVKVNSGDVKPVSVKYDSEDYYFNWKSRSYQKVDLSNGSTTIKKSGIYEISGTLKDGSLAVEVDKKTDEGIVYLVLNNASLSSSTTAPIYIKDAKKVVLILENGTANTIYQGSGVDADKNGDPSAAVFSMSDLTITGCGTLNATSDFNDGITSKDKLKITDGTLVIKSKSDGIVGKDVLAVEKASISIIAGKDGMRSTNDTDTGMGNIKIGGGSYTITAKNDAVQAYGILQVDGGTFNLTSGGGYTGQSIKTNTNGPGMGGRPDQTVKTSNTESMKCLKSAGGILLDGGTFTIQAGDDAIHSGASAIINGGIIEIKNSYEGIEGNNITVNNGKISLLSSDDSFNVSNSSGLLTISGGEIHLNSEGDGLDSNGSAKMTGGIVYVDGPIVNNNGAIDYDKGFAISGGTIVAAGSSGMAEAPDTSSSQPSILMYFSSSQAAGTAVTLKDSSGKAIASFTPAKQYASVAISTPDMKKGSNYTLYKGDTRVVTFTLSDTVTYLNESGITTNQSMGPGGGGFGKGGHGGGGPGAPGKMGGSPGGSGSMGNPGSGL